MRLVLFDVDGTLLRCGPSGRRLFGEALVEVYGEQGDLAGYDFSGKTDPQIVAELLTAAGRDGEEVARALLRFRDVYLDRLEAGLDAADVERLPAASETLAALGSRDDVALGLLTGNWQRGAMIKLSRAGIDAGFRFGGFGDDGAHRPDLLPVALARAAAVHGRRFEPRDAIVVGDSVHDVACARAHGALAVAVTTGWTPAAALRAAGADHLLDGLERLVELVG